MKSWNARVVALGTVAALLPLTAGVAGPANAADPPGSFEVTVQYVPNNGNQEAADFATVHAINQTTGVEYPASLKSSNANSSTFSVSKLPVGKYKVRVGGGVALFPQWWPTKYTAESAAVVEVTDNSICDGTSAVPCAWHRFTGELYSGRLISGRVASRAGVGSAGATVKWVRSGESAFRGSAVTDQYGNYKFEVPPGTYTITTANGGREASAVASVTNGSAAADLTLLDKPSTPRDVQAVEGSKKANVTWLPPSDDGGSPITGYRVTSTPGGHICTTTSTACQVLGLDNNKAYTFRVQAENAVGISDSSAATVAVIPLDPPPTAPSDVRASLGNRAATVSWAPPRVGADTVVGYQVVSSPGGYTCSTAGLSCEVSGLSNGIAYTFRVLATSTGGDSPASEPSAPVTPASVPTAPRNVRTQAGDGLLQVTWDAPHDDGGAPVMEYVATAWPGGQTCAAPAPTGECVIAGLTNGTRYSVTVTATNRMGVSERSPGSVQVAPEAAPGKGGGEIAVVPVSAKLKRVAAARGKITVRWKVAGATQARVVWRQQPGGPRKSQTTSPSGRMVLKGKPGTRYKVVVRSVNTAGPGASSSKVFTIAR